MNVAEHERCCVDAIAAQWALEVERLPIWEAVRRVVSAKRTIEGSRCVGPCDGLVDGPTEGLEVVGNRVGLLDGVREGFEVVGVLEGLRDGERLGLRDGLRLGVLEGVCDGEMDGDVVNADVVICTTEKEVVMVGSALSEPPLCWLAQTLT